MKVFALLFLSLTMFLFNGCVSNDGVNTKVRLSGAQHEANMSADEALKRLKDGNEFFMHTMRQTADVSPAVRQSLAAAQYPYAVILSCSDSRVIPEDIFSAGLGELFVIRVAGNVLGNHQLGSIQYALKDLGSKLVVVVGHESCGVIEAAIEDNAEGYLKSLSWAVKNAIEDETDRQRASEINAEYVADNLKRVFNDKIYPEVKIISAYYHLDGTVDFKDF